MPKSLPSKIVTKFFTELPSESGTTRFQIIVANCYLELFVNQLAIHKCKNKNKIKKSNRDFTHSIKITLLHEVGIIGDWELKYLDWFRKRRNEAAHNVEFSITNEHLKLFREHQVKPGEPKLDPNNIGKLCEEIVAGFWNMHADFFAPLFMPELFLEGG